MAFGFNNGTANNSNLTRSPSYIDYTQSWTISFWYRQGRTVPGAGTYRQPLIPNAGSGPYIYVGSQVAATNLVLEVSSNGGTTFFDTPPFQPQAETWLYITARHNATTHLLELLVNAVIVGSMTQDITGYVWTGATDEIGAGSAAWGDFSVIYYRAWQAVLTDAEITLEQGTYEPVRKTNLVSDARLTAKNDLSDLVMGTASWTLSSADSGVSTVTGPFPLTSRQVIPAGSLIFGGNGQGVDGAGVNRVMQYYLPSGVALGQPLTQPNDGPGGGVVAIISLFPSGRVVTIGGGNPNFPTTGIGVYNPDMTILAEGQATGGSFPSVGTIARDFANYWYGTDGNLLFKYDANGAPVQTWDLTTIVSAGFNCAVIAVNADGTLAYVVGNNVSGSLMQVYKVDLVHSTASLFLDLTSWLISAAIQAMFCRSGGNLIVAVDTGPSPNFNGFIREYDPLANFVADYDITTNSSSGQNISPVWITPDPNSDNRFWAIYAP